MMKRLRALAVVLLPISALATPPTGFVSITASHLSDGAGNLATNATISFAPANNAGGALSYHIGSTAGGQSVVTPVTAVVTSGAFTIPQIAASDMTNPANACYLVTLTDNVTGAALLAPEYGCVQPTALSTGPLAAANSYWCNSATGVCNFDAFIPNEAALGVALTPVAPTLSMGSVTVNTTDAGAASITGVSPNFTLNIELPLAPSATDTTKVPLAGGSMTGPLLNTVAPNFTASAYQFNSGFLDGTVVPSAEFTAAQGAVIGFDQMVTGAAVPSGSSLYQFNAFASYVTSASNLTYTTAGYFSARALANGFRLYGINPVFMDNGFIGNGYGDETDCNPLNQYTSGACHLINGAGYTGDLVGFNALDIQKAVGRWTYAEKIEDGSSASGFLLGALTRTANNYSQPFSFEAYAPDGTQLLPYFQADPSGDIKVVPYPGAALLLQTAGAFANWYASTSLNTAQAGAVRLAAGDGINWRNAANTADVSLAKNSSDQLQSTAAIVAPSVLPANGYTGSVVTGSCTLTFTNGILTAAVC